MSFEGSADTEIIHLRAQLVAAQEREKRLVEAGNEMADLVAALEAEVDRLRAELARACSQRDTAQLANKDLDSRRHEALAQAQAANADAKFVRTSAVAARTECNALREQRDAALQRLDDAKRVIQHAQRELAMRMLDRTRPLPDRETARAMATLREWLIENAVDILT